MQNREAEVRFAQYGHKFQELLSDSVNEWIRKLGDLLRGAGQDFDQMGSRFHFGDTLLGQIKVTYLRFHNPTSGQSERIEISMGHDKEWNPVISVSSSNTDPVAVSSKGIPNDDVAAIKEEVLACFDKAKLKMR